jgi:hypothetical protein
VYYVILTVRTTVKKTHDINDQLDKLAKSTR